MTFCLWRLMLMYLQYIQQVASKPNKKKLIFNWQLGSHWQKEDDPDPDPEIKCADPRIRIRTKMSRIQNTALYRSPSAFYLSILSFSFILRLSFSADLFLSQLSVSVRCIHLPLPLGYWPLLCSSSYKYIYVCHLCIIFQNKTAPQPPPINFV